MIYDLNLFSRLTRSTTGIAYPGDFTALARNWERSSAAIGGYLLGSFELTQEDLTLRELKALYGTTLGCRLEEVTFGMVSWEGLLYEFRFVDQGREHRRTLDPEWFHNYVNVFYSYPAADDSEQGNLTYNPGGNDAFQDDGQDFSEWETLAGDAAFSISVTNSDETVAWGFLAGAFTTTNANDSIYVYTDEGLTSAGWNGDYSGKTPSSYEVSSVALKGGRLNTGWASNEDSKDEYGRAEYIMTLGGTAPEAATSMRDRELAEFAWPRSRKVGGGSRDPEDTGRPEPAVLEVSVAGYWVTLNWRYQRTRLMRPASDLITYLLGQSEFVTAGRIETNSMRTKVDTDPIPVRRGDAIQDVILDGDLENHIWQGGVYAGRTFVYEQAPTTVEFYERADGVLVDKARVPVVPTLMKPGVLLMDETAPTGGQPAGTSNVWDDPRVGYVQEVRFTAPNGLEYRIMDEEESQTALQRKIERGLWRLNR